VVEAVPDHFRIALAQINTTVGDIDGNAAKVVDWATRASAQRAQLVAFPELTLSGYPPEDLLLKRHFLDDVRAALERLAVKLGELELTALVGFPEADGDRVFNSLAVIAGGEVASVYRKMLLPNYGVFDEKRYFEAGQAPAAVDRADLQIGLTVCEDIWEADSPALARSGDHRDRLLINVSASPYHRGKGAERQQMLADRAREQASYVVLCALVGAQDELIFDGQSMVLDPSGELIARAKQFEQDLLIVDLKAGGDAARIEPALPDLEEVYRALCVGLADYTAKNGFEHVVFGISGGIDSALVACIAADALGPEHVSCAVMPSPHSSDATQGDARQIARRLGVELFELPIEPEMRAYAETLEEAFAGSEPGIAEENVQARIRGTLVMALSNKFGWLALSTGNKSEYSVGYTTLYGDMAGGFAVLKDVPKTLVFELSRYRNQLDPEEAPIPASVIERPPSAELRPDQRDQDSLPPYALLDQILEAYVEDDRGRDALIAGGFDAVTVDRVIALVDHSEYKRRQSPPGVRITPKAFGRDRRLPITNRFRG
jgi:NAD+ synthase (glutamine-hydrolysing)